VDELRAADVFENLWAIRPVAESVETALTTLTERRLSNEEHAAVEHYAAEGQRIEVLADSARQIAAAALAAAEAIAPSSSQPGLAEAGTLRRVFQDSVVLQEVGVRDLDGAPRARRLAEAMTYRNAKAPELVKHVIEDRVDAWMAVCDLVDAAAFGALLAEQLAPLA
jgi:hypothetical protein